jgi:hypothetical protein
MPETTPYHRVVTYDPSRWDAVPANNGANGPAWQWGDELLAGFTRGTFSAPSTSHQCDNDRPFESWLARSENGGESWQTWLPAHYAGSGEPPLPLPAPLDFTSPGFAMRVEGHGYHGNAGAHWFASLDRGASWRGPYGFGNLLAHAELVGSEFTGRTAYLVEGADTALLFLSARARPPGDPGHVSLSDKSFVARMIDGGRSFEFVSWIVPRDDPARAVMPAPVRCSSTDLVVALRRRSDAGNWIDVYRSGDDGATWAFLSKVADTAAGDQFNGNPPALVAMADGRLCCAYGNRSARQIRVRFSADHGATWGPERVLRDDFHSVNGWPDLGYCRLFQRPDGKLVVVYFWCTETRPETHIEATIYCE